MSELWDNLSRSERYVACDDESQSAGFGEAPQQAFLRPEGAAKIASVATLALLAVSALPLKCAKKRRLCFHTSSVSFSDLSAWIITSISRNSFSSRELSMASIRFLQSLPAVFSG